MKPGREDFLAKEKMFWIVMKLKNAKQKLHDSIICKMAIEYVTELQFNSCEVRQRSVGPSE